MYVCDKDVESMARRLNDDISMALEWFKPNWIFCGKKNKTNK